jgi:hypothetical protein
MYKVVPVYAIVLLLGLLLCGSDADAARDFPENARRGTITEHQYPFYKIGASTYRMAAGGRIYNQQNLIIMPASFYGKAEIMYRLDMRGELSAIWLLTGEEAARYKKPATIQPTEGAVGR